MYPTDPSRPFRVLDLVVARPAPPSIGSLITERLPVSSEPSFDDATTEPMPTAAAAEVSMLTTHPMPTTAAAAVSMLTTRPLRPVPAPPRAPGIPARQQPQVTPPVVLRRRCFDLRMWIARLVCLLTTLPRLPRRDVATGSGPGEAAPVVGRWLVSVAELVEGLAGQGLGLPWMGPSEVVKRGGRPALRSGRLAVPLGRSARIRSDHVLPPEAQATGVSPGTPAATAWCAGATALWLAGRAPGSPEWGRRIPATAWWAAARRWQASADPSERTLAAVVERLLRPVPGERLALSDVAWFLEPERQVQPRPVARAA